MFWKPCLGGKKKIVFLKFPGKKNGGLYEKNKIIATEKKILKKTFFFWKTILHIPLARILRIKINPLKKKRKPGGKKN